MLLMRRDNIDRTFEILKNKRFDSPWSPGDYDAGMNFLGVQGELKVHELHYRTATLYFEWLGEVSAPRRKEDYKDLKPNVLAIGRKKNPRCITLKYTAQHSQNLPRP